MILCLLWQCYDQSAALYDILTTLAGGNCCYRFGIIQRRYGLSYHSALGIQPRCQTGDCPYCTDKPFVFDPLYKDFTGDKTVEEWFDGYTVVDSLGDYWK